MEENVQDVEAVESSATEESNNSNNQPAESTSQEASAPAESSNGEQTQEKQIPFHEHPRFKELIEQKNQFAEQNKQFQAELQKMQRQFADMEKAKAAATRQEDPLLTRLKGIDPEFGGRFEKLSGLEEKIAKFEQWQQQQDNQRIYQEYQTSMASLHQQYKVPEELKGFYAAKIEAEARSNPNLGVKDIPGIYKNLHEQMSKYMESAKRADRESYVAGKKVDATKPGTQAKGKPVGQAKPDYSKMSEQEVRHSMVQQILRSNKAGKDI